MATASYLVCTYLAHLLIIINIGSGFQTGGEFLAIIAIRAKDRNQANHIKAEYG
jgi:hypothetical protein